MDSQFNRGMAPTPSGVRRETARRLRRLGLQVGDDIRGMRLDASVSLAAVSRATGIDAAYLGRIETGRAQPSTEVLIAIGVALGADLSVRYFPGSGPRIHDRFQAPMVEALIRALHPRWQIEIEVPVTQPSRGVIDIVLADRGSGDVIAVEAQSDLRRLEQQVRWAHEKSVALATRLDRHSSETGPRAAPGGLEVSQLLLLRSTVRTRTLARQFEATLLAAFPNRAADAHRSLIGAAPWPGSTIVWMNVHGGAASIMRLPPPGVRLGR